jgi:hypothetical protein
MNKAILFATAAVCSLCLPACAGDAANVDGLLSGGYTYTDFSGTNVDTYNVGGIAKFRFESAINVQGSFDYTHIDVPGASADNYAGGGAVFWRDDTYALGAFGQYNHAEIIGFGTNFETFGLVGEQYGANWTLRTHIAGLTADGANGAYGGGGVVFYAMPDLSLNVDGSFNNFGPLHWGDVTIGAEYLFSHEVPISIGAGYIHTMYTRGPNTDALTVRLTWHIGDGGSLIDVDRSGPMRINQPNMLPF